MTKSYRELFQLSTEKKWEYMLRYYNAAHDFYEFHENAVDEKEIDEAIRTFKQKPIPKYRKSILLTKWSYKHDYYDHGIAAGYFSKSLEDMSWEEICIPHSTRDVPENPIRYGTSNYPFMIDSAKDVWCGVSDNWYRKKNFP